MFCLKLCFGRNVKMAIFNKSIICLWLILSGALVLAEAPKHSLEPVVRETQSLYSKNDSTKCFYFGIDDFNDSSPTAHHSFAVSALNEDRIQFYGTRGIGDFIEEEVQSSRDGFLNPFGNRSGEGFKKMNKNYYACCPLIKEDFVYLRQTIDALITEKASNPNNETLSFMDNQERKKCGSSCFDDIAYLLSKTKTFGSYWSKNSGLMNPKIIQDILKKPPEGVNCRQISTQNGADLFKAPIEIHERWELQSRIPNELKEISKKEYVGLRAKLIAKSKVRPSIAPYKNSLVEYRYEVVEVYRGPDQKNQLKFKNGEKVTVQHWAYLDQALNAHLLKLEEGQEYYFSVTTKPALKENFMVDSDLSFDERSYYSSDAVPYNWRTASLSIKLKAE